MKRKLLKLTILMIVLLLNCLKIYAQDIPSTGWKNNADTVYVSIPIEYIRLANQKMIERNYLEEVNEVKDSIIVDYKNTIDEYRRMHQDYSARIAEYNRINDDLAKRLNRQRKTSLVCGTIAGVSISIIVIAALIN